MALWRHTDGNAAMVHGVLGGTPSAALLDGWDVLRAAFGDLRAELLERAKTRAEREAAVNRGGLS